MCTLHPLSAAELFNLKGWVAVVIAQTLAANGAKVYITGRLKEVLEKNTGIHGSAERLGSSGGSIVPLVMDVRSKESNKAMVDEISAKETHVDVMLNIVFMTNCVSIYYVTAAFILLLSKTAASPPIALSNVMNVSKAAGLHLTKPMAYELQKKSFNIRVNAIAPDYCAVTTENWNTPQDLGSCQAVLTLATNGQVYGTVIPIENGVLLRHPSVI
ncbi:hypothetical protein F5X96DRAFT_682488 [Biscogniauxia mediterranea]|nr:hypothetical protein F5X96DRAFT_682488 [Biscogniauxia mediterranea]